MSSWREFWNGDTPIYASPRHKQLHYRRIATDIVRLIDEFSPQRAPRLLDHGCGEALSAGEIARRCEQLYLLDSAPVVVDALRRRHARDASITVLAEGGESAISPQSLDLVIVNSVVQYLTPDEFAAALRGWHALLRPDGRLVLADIIPRRTSALTDALALLRFAWRGGFFLAALAGLVRTVFSDYRRLRQRLGIAHYDQADLQPLLAATGFGRVATHANLGHNAARLCLVCQRT